MLESKYTNVSHIYPVYPSFFLVHKDYQLDTKRVIDLWASNGRYVEYFWEGSVWVEYNSPDRLEAEKKGLNVVFWNLNEDFTFFKNEDFDVIFSSHVIEHLDSPYLFLKRIRSFWWEQAKLILGYPIEASLVRLFDPYFAHDGHIYAFSLENMKKLLKETGFAIERVYVDIPFAWKWKFFHFLQGLVQHLPFFMVSWWANAIYIVAKKI